MNSTALSLSLVAAGFAVWMAYLGRRAAVGALGRTGPGIRVPAAKVCEHTWRAAQVAAAPRYTKLAAIMIAVGLATIALDLAGVDGTTVVIAWFVAAIGAQFVLLAGAGRDATLAATAVRCEHQTPPKPERATGTRRATSRTNAGRSRANRNRRR
jgi:hypothetical protein